MAVKYKRDEDQKFDWNVRGRSPEAVRKKTLYIYAGLSVALMASLVMHLIGGRAEIRLKPSAEGIAVVIEKIVISEGVATPQHFLRCEVKVPLPIETEGQETTTKGMGDLVLTDEVSFARVKEGDQIAVMYRVTGDYKEMRIHKMILTQLVLPKE
jgi:hypothetical protein